MAALGVSGPTVFGGIKKERYQTWPERLARSVASAVMLPGDVYSGKTQVMDPATGHTSEDVIGRAADLAGTVTLGSGMVPGAANEARMGVKAYHGSPHDFDKFDMSKIGTGEGAQAYGHGLYFAENEGVAKEYRKALAGQVANPARNARMAELAKEMTRYEIPGKYRKYRDRKGDEAAAEYDRLMEQRASDTGRTYEVDINAHPDEFLDWDKPLSEQQSPVVQKALDSVLTSAGYGKGWAFLGSPEGTEALRAAGIKGIRYKDAGSRGADAAGGTHNYVVFDDATISILKKYGIVGLTGGLGALAAAGMGPSDAQAASGPLGVPVNRQIFGR